MRSAMYGEANRALCVLGRLHSVTGEATRKGQEKKYELGASYSFLEQIGKSPAGSDGVQ